MAVALPGSVAAYGQSRATRSSRQVMLFRNVGVDVLYSSASGQRLTSDPQMQL